MRTIQREIVTILLYSKDGKLLMGRKDPLKGGVYPDSWHIPGGGINEGETHKDAVIREVKEEVGLDVSNFEIVFVTDEDSDTAVKTLNTGEQVSVDMHFNVYKVQLEKDSSEIALQCDDDLIEARWFSQPELSKVKLTPPSVRYFQKRGYIQS